MKSPRLFPLLEAMVIQLEKEFDEIPEERKIRLNELTQFVRGKIKSSQKAQLNFICTHNSRRSHMAQLWAQAAAHYHQVNEVECFSGGTDTIAFSPRAVKTMKNIGFEISKTEGGDNPVYEVNFSNQQPSVISFSKKYDDPVNPKSDFAAVMTCSYADENCPIVLGASIRIAITYDDPKAFDGTPLEEPQYKERAQQIGREMLFAFSRVNPT